ncbi:solute carrier family 22 member 6-like [Ylistrum balloti]|uniref:solute carrier family 22 member 6-like n=1 Tax=Ylistrum balloti TaxID=509963 RepID=UPI002905C4F6|nr:solute carrier family 22 member 6-like [Ylistrum balloti]
MTSALSLYMENVIEESGGFGRFQTLLFLVTMPAKFGMGWSMLMMSIAGAVPEWWCMDDDSSEPGNSTESPVQRYQNDSNLYECSFRGSGNSTKECQTFKLNDSLYTIVNEWDLICDRDDIPSTITTIQMSGILVSGLIAGQFADYYGRKPTYFLSMLILLLGNIGCAFSVGWEMFAAFRFLIGFALGCYITVYYTYMIEFTPTKYRAIIVTIPLWPLGLCVLALVGWWLHDWKALHIANAIAIAPLLLFWGLVPESFRWLVSHNRLPEAESVINRIARTNGRPTPDLCGLVEVTRAEVKPNQRRVYSVKDLFSSWMLFKTTVLLAISWFCSSYVYYAISFGVQNLSGDIYFNFFLIQVIDIPAMMLTYVLVNVVGRRPLAVALYALGGLTGLAVAAIEISDIADKETMRTVFALITKVAVVMAWSGLQLLTSESYPTVVRNIGYGLQSAVARTGSMLAPKIVYLNNDVPGIMYFLAGGCMLLTAVACVFLMETKDRVLVDSLKSDTVHKDPEKERLISDTNPKMEYTDNKTNMNVDGVEFENNDLTASSHLISVAEKQMEDNV